MVTEAPEFIVKLPVVDEIVADIIIALLTVTLDALAEVGANEAVTHVVPLLDDCQFEAVFQSPEACVRYCC